ncbi:uncharacterized protein LOC111128440 isoform X2 [Crassostrea virginica]
MDGKPMAAIRRGTRVVSGPDWKWDNQDDGEGFVGTVICVPKHGSKDHTVTVVWDSGLECLYRAGHNGKYDLRVFDSAPSGLQHDGIDCDICDENNIHGLRWKCLRCDNFDLCTICYMNDEHSTGHRFVRIDTPNCSALPVPPRRKSNSIEAFGLFPNAEVIRGPHWKWQDQDGGIGQVGKILEVKSWDDYDKRGAVKVKWKSGSCTKRYRVGAHGCVDVIYTQKTRATSGGKYYPDHLPVVAHVDVEELGPGGKACEELTGKFAHQLQASATFGDWHDSMQKIRRGTRVVRGPDWKWDNQDDGEGFVGTVIFVPKHGSKDHTVTVVWDSGLEHRYRAGHNGKYDLRVFDSAPTGIKHDGVVCDICDEDIIYGLRWKCLRCDDFDLCTICYMNDEHSTGHGFVRIDTPNCSALPVPPRRKSYSIEAFGLFHNAEVIRGPHWKWQDQDGGIGQVGKILEMKSWDDYDKRGAVKVKWKSGSCTNTYRVGAHGCVDVIYTQKTKATSGGKYYPDHLPVVAHVDVEELGPGDKACEELTGKFAHQLQASATFGGWHDSMQKIRRGTRVVRGPDWKWDNQDDGEGFAGTVIFVPKHGSKDHTVTVVWDSGLEHRYRAGHNGKYDLRVFDSAPTGIKHDGVVCDICDEDIIYGLRWKCLRCDDFDLCTICYMNDEHSTGHGFVRIDTPNCSALPVPPRRKSYSIEAFGLFHNAEVIRGPHWKWQDQDGGIGQVGKILEMKSWDDYDKRGAVKVKWKSGSCTNTYRVGAHGCVDVIYTQKTKATSGGKYYPDHLPVVAHVDVEELGPGDKACEELTGKFAHQLQASATFGGWHDSMQKQCPPTTTKRGIETPSNWEKMTDGYKRVLLSPDAKGMIEYEEVAKKFKKTMKTATILQIERVQNAYNWEVYELLRRKMEKKNGQRRVNERDLYHGTDPHAVEVICKQNMDFRLAGKKVGHLYGKGTYFARDARKSDPYASSDDYGNKYMFLVKVLCGNMALGKKTYTRPPPLNRSDPHSDLYDCCVDDVDDPTIFCIFDPNQYYPRYLIKYR